MNIIVVPPPPPKNKRGVGGGGGGGEKMRVLLHLAEPHRLIKLAINLPMRRLLTKWQGPIISLLL